MHTHSSCQVGYLIKKLALLIGELGGFFEGVGT
jgi:hypothetical protein